MKRFYVYGIWDPRDGELRYIGKGQRSLKYDRLANTVRWTANKQLQSMLSECQRLGFPARAKVIFELSNSADAILIERVLINLLRFRGYKLFNGQQGVKPGIARPNLLMRYKSIFER